MIGEIDMRVKEGFIRVTGGNVWYQIHDKHTDKTPVIILHGGPGSSHYSLQGLKMGIRIPQDLSLIGFDGIQLCELTSPEITTMAQPIYELGESAAKLLLDMIEGKAVNPAQQEFKVSLKIGQSTKVLR